MYIDVYLLNIHGNGPFERKVEVFKESGVGMSYEAVEIFVAYGLFHVNIVNEANQATT